ncbi:MAG: hypothetical protein D6701_08615, partial [Gemmatimonadetes bacterium]
MDGFDIDIDMETLRRLGAVRSALDGLEGDAAPAVAAVEHAGARLVKDGPAWRLMKLVAGALADAPSDELTPTSRLATAVAATLGCVEQFLISEDEGAAAESLIHQAAATLLVAVGRDPAEWNAVGGEGGVVAGSAGKTAANVAEATVASAAAEASETPDAPAGPPDPESVIPFDDMPEPLEPSLADALPDLDRIASLVIELEPTDRRGLGELRDAVAP